MGKVLKHGQIVFATPIYWYSCAPPMKVFLDRISDYLDVPELLELGRLLRGKVAYVACTSARDEPSEHFCGAFRDTFEYLGMQVGGLLHVNCVDGYQGPKHNSVVRDFAEKMKFKAV
jgi:multimeric flavodoxin WrbA